MSSVDNFREHLKSLKFGILAENALALQLVNPVHKDAEITR